jgi:thioredoxin 1
MRLTFFIMMITIVFLNCHNQVAAKYNVSAMPTFIFIKSGEIIDRLMGANVDRLQEMIDEHK